MNLAELLTDLSIHFNGIVRRSASRLNLTTSQAYLLLSIPPDGIPMSELASKLELDNSTLTRNIQKLETVELVIRQGDTYDKRVYKVFITPSGENTINELEALLNETSLAIADKLDLDVQNALVEVLEKLVWSLDCISEEML